MSEALSPDRLAALRGVGTLEELYAGADGVDMTPGWVPRQTPILWPEPRPTYRPALWRYEEAKAALDAAGRLIDVKLAERRNLAMRNPIPDSDWRTTRTLVAAYQMILPGEHAPTHRHAPHALRVILDGHGSYSVVDGEKTPMESGDVVLTPGGCWHGHGHDGDVPAYWLDVLDVPLTHLLEPMYYEEHPERYPPPVKTVSESPYRFSRDSIARRLDKARSDNEGFHGPRIELPAPTMPVMALSVERLAAGGRTRRQRSTANHIFCAMQGTGETVVGDTRFAWQAGDTFAVPSWTKYEHRATSDTQLFECSDEPLMRFANYYRFEAD
jgi:gentisate 1,2-dioxygenase